MVKDPYNQTLLTQDYTVSTDGTILSMTYTPTPNFGGSVTAGEFTFHYDACGNMVLMTNSSGDPQLSYDIDRATNGIVNTYNPGNMENIIGIGGRRGQLTIPGFGDDDMTLPIQRPGQFAVIGDNGQAGSGWIQDVDSSGSSPGITGPCGEVGTCGGEDCDNLWRDISFSNLNRTRYKEAIEVLEIALFSPTPSVLPKEIFCDDDVLEELAAILSQNGLNPNGNYVTTGGIWVKNLSFFRVTLGFDKPKDYRQLIGYLIEAYSNAIKKLDKRIKDNCKKYIEAGCLGSEEPPIGHPCYGVHAER